MKRFIGIALGAALVLAAITTAAPARADVTNQKFDQRSPLRFIPLFVNVGGTSSVTGTLVGVAPGPGKIVDIQLGQAAVGVGGTSWTATVKKNGTAVCSTNGVVALASGANVSLNSSTDPDLGWTAALALPSGATRPILNVDSTVTVAKGDVITVDITNTGAYSTAFVGQVKVLINPAY
jgi:hypothetical protein